MLFSSLIPDNFEMAKIRKLEIQLIVQVHECATLMSSNHHIQMDCTSFCHLRKFFFLILPCEKKYENDCLLWEVNRGFVTF